MVITKRELYLTAALIWGIPGFAITYKGIAAYNKMPQPQLWLWLTITFGVIIFFYIIFKRVAGQYIKRIATLSNVRSLYQTFPTNGWILLLFMIMLGIILKNIPTIPLEFTASFYSGLGPMLILSSIQFLRAALGDKTRL